MAYVKVDDPLLNSAKPGRSTDWKQFRDNQEDFNSRINALELNFVASEQDILDHFMGKIGINLSSKWERFVGASDTAEIVDEHQLKLATNGITTSDFALVCAADSVMRIDKTHEYIAIMEVRIKGLGGASGSITFGFNDDGLNESNGDLVSDTTDYIGFIHNFGTGNWAGKNSNAGSSEGVAGDMGTFGSWTVLRIEVTCSATAGNRQTEFFVNGSSQEVLSDETKMPTAVLRPVLGVRGDTTSTARDVRFDYAEFRTKEKPLAA
jgi:hypothetical protein